MRTLLALCLVGGLAAFARPADACSPPMCRDGSVLPAKGTVPVNLPALQWRPLRSFDAPDATPSFRLLNEEGAEIEVVVRSEDARSGVLLAPAAPLPVGETVRFEGESACNEMSEPTVAELLVGPEAPLPSVLGTLEIEPTFRDYLHSGPCGSDIDAAQVRARVKLSDAAAPWSEALVFETHVDGRPWTRFASRGEALVFAFCGPGRWDDGSADKGLTPGFHTVQMSARVLGTATVLGTAAWTIDLRCDAPWEAPEREAGPLEPEETPRADEEGCASAGISPLALMLGLLVVLRKR